MILIYNKDDLKPDVFIELKDDEIPLDSISYDDFREPVSALTVAQAERIFFVYDNSAVVFKDVSLPYHSVQNINTIIGLIQ